MAKKNVMILFKVNLNRNYKDLLLQHLSQFKQVHIKPKSEKSGSYEMDKELFDRIKTLSQNLETLFKDLNITESDIQKLSFEESDRPKFKVKNIDDLINQVSNEINYFSNRINELKKYLTSIEIELDKINTIHGSYLFLEKYKVTRDKLSKFKHLEFKAFTSFSKNLENIEVVFDFSHFPNFLHYDFLSDDRIAFFIIYPKEQEVEFRERIRIIHAEEVPILKKYLLSDGINFPRIAKEIKFVVTSLNKNQSELERLRDDNILLFAAAYEIVQNLEEYNWVSYQFEELSSDQLSLSFYLPKEKKEEIYQALIDKFQDKLTIESVEIVKNKQVKLASDKISIYSEKSKSAKKSKLNEEIVNKKVEKDDLRTSAPTIMKNFFLFKPFETITRMFGIPAYSEIDPTPILAITFPLLFGIMFGDIGHGIVLILSGLLGFIIYRNKKSRDFLNFCWIILYCGIGAIIFGFLYSEFFGMNEIKLFNTVFLHLESITIPILNISLHNPLDNIMTVLKFAVLIGVFHLNLGWFIQFMNYWKQKRKYLGFTDSMVKILLLTGGTILIFVYGFDIYSWLEPPFPILLTIIPAMLLIILKPIGKILHISYLKKESVGGLIGEGTMETFETLLSILSNVSSYIRLLALALAHVSLMIAITAMVNLIQGGGIVNEIISYVGLVFGNMIVILLEGLLVFINAMRLHFYEFFFKFYQGSGVTYIPFYLNDKHSEVLFEISSTKDVISEEIDKEIESKKSHQDIIKAEKYISGKYL
ncbi:MAG TPA: V-type ATPase 116kDa subunit family protein [Candidatus Nanopelagicaceae bacterium]|nr:V-type ATPase 116kDa subunit family protein [Candidatus Nanopelagicaceae bacterium]